MGLRLLAVDDHRESLDLIMAILVNAGADVRVSASAAEALRIVQDWRPHVLISDIEMPGEDGYAFIRKVRSLDAEGGRFLPWLSRRTGKPRIGTEQPRPVSICTLPNPSTPMSW